MTAIKRINSFITGILMILVSVLFVSSPKDSLILITAFLSLTLFIYGIRMFIYFITLARHMTGGLTVLYRAALVFDLGLFALKLPEFPLMYVMIYLAVIHGFSGIAAILKSLESIRLEAPSWKLNLINGIINTVMALLCLIFSKSISTAVIIYCLGLLNSGAIRIAQAFYKTTNVYVQ